MTSSKGQLTLFAKDGGSNTFYQPINNKLMIGSDEIADCRLNGLKNIAFVINIDSFGRVFIESYMKRLKVGGKRLPKKVQRPLMNNSVIEILEYKLCWKYNPKFSKSFSMSPCPKPNQPIDKDILSKRRKTVLSFDSTTVKDESEFESELQSTSTMADNQNVPVASIENENDENVPSVATTPKKNPLLCSITSPCRSPFKPIVELHGTHDQIIDLEASEECQTLSKNISSQEMSDGEKVIESTPSKRRTSLIPVRENRAAELRRASIRKSLSKNDQSSSMYFTPKKPASSLAMVKGMNAIIRVGLDEEDTIMNNGSSSTNRNILDSTNLQKLVETPNKSLTKVIDEMNMFNVVTDQMKKVGPSVYVSATKKFGAVNSPRRTPKRGINTPKRQSLRSELTEMGLLPPVQEPSNDDKQQAVAVPANPNLSMLEGDDSDEMECLVISDEEDDQSIEENNKEDIEVSDDESSSDTSLESVISVDDESSEDSGAVLTESIMNVTSTLSSYSTDSCGTRIQTISEDERTSHLSDAQLTPEETANNDELNDSVFEGNQSASIAAESPIKLNSQQTEIRKRSIYSCGDLSEGTDIHVHDKQTGQQSEDQQTEICYDESSKNQLVMKGSEDVSTPSTGRKSLIRARRNSRLCSLEECCSPTTFGSPRKTKSAMKVPPSPRSILKTPNAPKTPKTPKRNVRILETILHEEEDEDLKITDDNISETPNLLDQTFEPQTESEAIESSIRNVSLGNVSLPIENNKSLIGQQSEPSSGLTSEITLEEEHLDSPEALEEIILSGTKNIQKAQSDKNISVIDADGVDERMDSSELSKKNEELQEYQLHSDSCVKNQEERPISPESNMEIIPSNFKQIQDNSSLNNERVEERFNLPQTSNEVIPSVIDEAQLDTNTSVDDAYEVDERMDSSELSKKNEKLQECQLNSDSCENDGEQVEERPNSSQSNTEIIPSDIKQLQDNSCVKNKEERSNSPESITEIIPSDIRQLQDNSGVNNGKVEERFNSSKPSKEVIPSVIEEAPLNTNIGVDDTYEVDERMDSSELSKKNEKLQECQLNSDSSENDGEQVEERPNSSQSNTEIIPSDIKQLQDNSCVNSQEERSNSPESITEIIPSDIKQVEDDSGTNNNGRVGEQFDLPQPSNEVIHSVIDEAYLDTNTGVDDAYKVDERMDSSELSKKNEKLQECQLNSDSCENNGEQVEERPNSSESITEILPSDIKQLQDNSCVNNQEERSNSPESITEIIPSDMKQLEDSGANNIGRVEERFDLPQPSNEVIHSVIEEAQLDTNTGVGDAYVDERMDSSELSKKNGKLQECQLNSDSCENDGEQVEERPNSPESNTEIIRSDIKQLQENSGVNNGPVEEPFNSSKPSKEVIPSDIEEALLNTNACVDDAYEVDERMDSSELSKKNEKLQESQLNSDSCENDGEQVEERPNSPESNTEIIHSDTQQLQDNSCVKNQEERPNSPESIPEIISSDIKQLQGNNVVNIGRVEERFNSSEPSKEAIPLVIEETLLNTNNGVDDACEVHERMDSSELSKKNEKLQECQLNSDSCENDEEQVEEQPNLPASNTEIIPSDIKQLQDNSCVKNQEERSNSPESITEIIPSDIKQFQDNSCANNHEERPNSPESNTEIIPSHIEELNTEGVAERANSLESNTELILSAIKQEPQLDSSSGLNDIEEIGKQLNSSEMNMEISIPCVKELQETLNVRNEVEGRTSSPDDVSSAIEESHLDTYRPQNNGEQVEEQSNSPESNSEIIPSDIEQLSNEKVVEQRNSLEPNTELILSGIKQEPQLDSNSGLHGGERIEEQKNSSETNMEISVLGVKKLQETLDERNEVEERTNSPDVISSAIEESHLDTYRPQNNGEQVEQQHNSPESNSEIIPSNIEELNNETIVEGTDSLEPNTELILSGIKQEPQLDSKSGLNDVEGIGEKINSSETNMEISVPCVKELQETLNERDEVEGLTNSPEPCKEIIPSVNEELSEAKLDSSESDKKIEKRQECLVQEPSNLPDLNMETSISCINELQEDSNSGMTDGEGIEEPTNSSETDMEISVPCVKELQETLNDRDEVKGRTNSPEPCKEVITSASEELPEAQLDSNTCVNGAGGVCERIDPSEPNRKIEKRQECLLQYNRSTNNEETVQEPSNLPDLNMEKSISDINELQEAQLDSNSGLTDGEEIGEQINSSKTNDEISISCVKELQVTLHEREDGVEEDLGSPDMFNDTIENIEQLQNSSLESNKNDAVQVDVEDLNDDHKVGELLDSSKLHTETRLVGIEERLKTQSNSTNDEEEIEKFSNSPEIEKEISISSVNELQKASMNSNDGKEVNNETSSENKTGNESCKNFSIEIKYKSRETILHTINDALTSIGINPLKWCDSDIEKMDKEKGDVSNDISSQNPNVSTKDTFKDGIADVQSKVDLLSNEIHDDSSLSSLPTESMTHITLHSESAKPQVIDKRSDAESEKISSTPLSDNANSSKVPKERKMKAHLTDDSEAATSVKIDSQAVSETAVHIPTRRGRKTKTTDDPETSKPDRVELQKVTTAPAVDSANSSNVPTRKGHKVKTAVTNDLESTKSERIDSQKVSQTRKTKISDDSETPKPDAVELQEISVTPAVEKDHLSNVPPRRGRKKQSTVTEDSEETKSESVDSEKVPETPVTSENDVHLPTKRGHKNKTKIADDSETTDTVELQETPADVPPRKGRKKQSTVTEDSEETKLEKLDSNKVTEIPAASENNANIPTKRGRKNKAKIADGSQPTVELQKISATPVVEKDDLTNVPPRRGRKIQSTVTNDSEVAELEKLDSKKVTETPAASENANIPTRRGRKNKAKIDDGSEPTDTVELPKKSVTSAVENDDLTNVPLRRDRRMQSTLTNESEETKLEKLDSKKVTETPAASENDANIRTRRGRQNKTNIADDSKTPKPDTADLPKKSATPAVEKDDLTNVPPRRGRKIQSTVTNDSEEAELEKLNSKKITETPAISDNDANIPTKRGRTNKAKIADVSETTDSVKLQKRSATAAVKEDDLTNVPLRRGRKIRSTVTNDSEKTELEKLDSKKVTETPAASENDASIRTRRGRQNKTNIADDSKTPKPDTANLLKISATPTVEKDDLSHVPPRRGRKIEATVTNDSQKVTETGEDDSNIPTRKGRTNKTKVATGSKTAKPDTVQLEKISSTPAVDDSDSSNVPLRRGRKVKRSVSNISEATESELIDSQNGTETLVTGDDDLTIPAKRSRKDNEKAVSGSKATLVTGDDDLTIPAKRSRKDNEKAVAGSKATLVTGDDDLTIPAKRSRKDNEKAVAGSKATIVTGDDDLTIQAKKSRKDNEKAVVGSEAAKPEAVSTRRGRKVEKIEDSTQSKMKESQSSTISTRKRRRLSEVEVLHSETDAAKDIQASKVLKRTNRNTATHVSDEPEESKRRKVDLLKIPITRATRGSRNIEMNDELIQPKQIKDNESRPDPIVHNLRGIPNANVDEATNSTSVEAKSSVKTNNRPKRRNK